MQFDPSLIPAPAPDNGPAQATAHGANPKVELRHETKLARAIKLGERLAETIFLDVSGKLEQSQIHSRQPLLSPSLSPTPLFLSIDSATRGKFFSVAIPAAQREPDLARYFGAKLPFLLSATSNEERRDIIRLALNSCTGTRLVSVVRGVLESVPTLERLGSLIELVGELQLKKIKSKALTEILALSEIGLALRRVELPRQAQPGMSKATLWRISTELIKTLESLLGVIKTSSYPASETAKEFREALRQEKKALSNLIENAPKRKILRQELSRIQQALELEVRYGILIGEGPVEDPKGHFRPWELASLRTLKKALELFPENLLLFTPRLRRFVRCGDQQGNTDTSAQRVDDGLIEIFDFGVTGRTIADGIRGIPPLLDIITHEIWHGVQMGASAKLRFDQQSGAILQNGQPIWDFASFAAISGWEAYARGSYQVISKGKSVLLNGKHFNLDEPETNAGKPIVLMYDKGTNTLFSYRAGAKFPSQAYSRTTPWEDFAESGKDYLLDPLQLLRRAPEKFEFFEARLARYHKMKDQSVIRAWQAAVSPSLPITPASTAAAIEAEHRRQAVSRKSEFFAERFERLLPDEQRLVLTAAHGLIDPASIGKDLKAQQTPFASDDPALLLKNFRELLRLHPDRLDQANAGLRWAYSRYHPSLIAAMIAHYKGEEIGLMTARSNRKAHQLMIDKLEAFLGFKIQRRNQYFVTDTSKNQIIAGLPSNADRKMDLLLKYARGWYIGHDGVQRLMSKIYEVFFYDDEHKNLETLRTAASAAKLNDHVVAIDAKGLDSAGQWDMLMAVMEHSPPNKPNSSAVLRSFDIDGTLVCVPSMIRFKRISTNTQLKAITQLQYGAEPDRTKWYQQIHQARPEIPLADIDIDLDDYVLEERIVKQVNPYMFLLREYQPDELYQEVSAA